MVKPNLKKKLIFYCILESKGHNIALMFDVYRTLFVQPSEIVFRFTALTQIHVMSESLLMQTISVVG